MSGYHLGRCQKIKAGSATNKAVLMIYADCAGQDGRTWASLEFVAAAIELTERTVRRALGELEERGILVRTHETVNRHTVYRLQFDHLDRSGAENYLSPERSEKPDIDDRKPDIDDRRYRTSTSKKPDIDDSHKEHIKEQKKELRTNSCNASVASHSGSLFADQPEVPWKFVPPTLEQCISYAEENGMPKEQAEAFWDYWETRNWWIKKGSKMQKWKAAMGTWRRKSAEYASKDAMKASKGTLEGAIAITKQWEQEAEQERRAWEQQQTLGAGL